MDRHQKALFQDPQINYPVLTPHVSFQEYISQCRQIVERYRITHSSDNLPFELKPNKDANIACLLIHGLYDSPFMLKDIGRSLQAQGILVRSILLPGHGTVPGALLNTQYEDWVKTTEWGIQSLLNNTKQVFAIGFSTGALLAHFYQLNASQKLAGLISFAPAYQINSRLTFMANWHRVLSWKYDKLKWLNRRIEDDYVRYQSCTFNSIYQVARLATKLKKMNQPMDTPHYILIPYNDRTIDSKTTIAYFLKNASPQSKLLIYSKQALSYSDPRVIVRSSCYPDQHIEDFSHVSLTISPDNPHYGVNGDYLRMKKKLFAEKNTPIVYGALNMADEMLTANLYRFGLTKKLYLRLTYNPDFEFLCMSILNFIKG